MTAFEIVARAPWTIRLGGGKPRVAQPVSAEAFLRYQGEARQPDRGRQALFRLLRLAFPLRLSNWWHGDPVRQILALPPGDQAAVLADFFGSSGVGRQ